MSWPYLSILRLTIYRAIRRILYCYQVIDNASGLVHDANDGVDEVGKPRYIVELIGRVLRVVMETERIVKDLSSLGEDSCIILFHFLIGGQQVEQRLSSHLRL